MVLLNGGMNGNSYMYFSRKGKRKGNLRIKKLYCKFKGKREESVKKERRNNKCRRQKKE